MIVKLYVKLKTAEESENVNANWLSSLLSMDNLRTKKINKKI